MGSEERHTDIVDLTKSAAWLSSLSGSSGRSVTEQGELSISIAEVGSSRVEDGASQRGERQRTGASCAAFAGHALRSRHWATSAIENADIGLKSVTTARSYARIP